MAEGRLASAQPSFLHSERLLARAAQPLVRFVHVEAAGGIVLVVATVAALVWANSPWADSYTTFWRTAVRVDVGTYRFEEDLAHLVNDLLMGLFFLVVGMEIKRELVAGELRDPRAVALPAFAALGGMVVPAAVYVLIVGGDAGGRGWGVPMATDIAFALGVVALLGSRVPPPVKLLLLTLAIIDDIGAIAVIAVFYTSAVDVRMIAVAVGIALLVAVIHRIDVTSGVVIMGLGLLLWLAVYESGIHPTIAGVVMGLLTPAVARQTELEAEEIVDVLETGDDLSAAEVRAAAGAIRGSVSACDRLIDALHPWTSFVIVPVFALANAGIVLSGDTLATPSSVLVGVGVALVAGKLVGVAAFSWLAVRVGFGRLPTGTRWGHVLGIGDLAGIGFTVSLFIAGLAYESSELEADAKVGILLAAVVATVVGTAILLATSRRAAAAGHSDG
ncbi:MAG: Na+/H+ antiporter NhaA [Acidimicrobiia bacterium]|nr:Na+/H+ antiporter NhaA [Acidimicrobiia bacterium]